MTEGKLIRWIGKLMEKGDLHPFYQSAVWKHLSREVMREQHGECQRCRRRGFYHRGEIVHHVNHVRQRPELALSKTYIDKDGTEQANLIAVCIPCHNELHGREKQKSGHFVNEERW